jgi:hypothetical protein
VACFHTLLEVLILKVVRSASYFKLARRAPTSG